MQTEVSHILESVSEVGVQVAEVEFSLGNAART